MSMLRAFGVVSVAVVTVAACSNNGTSSPGADAAPDPGAACDSLFDAISGALTKCGLAVPADALAADKARANTSCVQSLSYPGQGVGVQTLNGCATAWGMFACRGSNPDVTTCAAKVGTLANGAACNGDAQCQSGYCNLNPATDGGAAPDCGTCSASVAVGAACQSTDHCVLGSACVGAVCVALGTVDVGGDCSVASTFPDTDLCKSGLNCDSQSKKCAALGGSGAACAADGDCQSGLSCINKACATALSLGAACSYTTTGAGCGSGLSCDPTAKKCVTVVYGNAGAPCGFLNGGYTACAQGPGSFNLCDMATGKLTGTCPAIIPDGAACSSTDKTKWCDYGAFCDPNTKVCTLAKPVCK